MSSLLQILNKSINSPRISTGSKHLDDVLGGGIGRGCVTELTGEAGAGKTQMILQMAVNLAADAKIALILDTEGKVCSERILQLMESKNVEYNCMERVLVRVCKTESDLLASIQLLPLLLQTKENIGGIFVDSIAQHFRFTNNQDARLKNVGVLHRMLQILNSTAYQYNLPVVLTNQVTVKQMDNDVSVQVPALGDTWLHCPSIRVMLKYKAATSERQYEPGDREATVVKSSSCVQSTVHFSIKKNGICDL